jgi:hypothetical protein
MNMAISIGSLIALFTVLQPLFATTRGLFNTVQGLFAIGAGTFALFGGLAVFGVGAALTMEQLSALSIALLKLS